MYYVASIMDNHGVIHLEALTFDNNHAGFSKFVDSISEFPKEELLIGLKSTVHYGEVFTQFVFKVAIINPLQTSTIRKAGIRKTKNDKIDSLIISKSLILNGGTLLEERDILTFTLKGLVKTKRNLISQRTRAKIQLVAYIEQLFPELASFFKGNLHIKTVQELLLQYITVKEISDLVDPRLYVM
ncbi:transposase [uncultured Ilyobacter sp.]|uniref:IS110 family transposase n=1 Tax=uncultured Ilyobacter sp. TaxID=544433 RepID=UPI0029F57C7B|nr:transposase [uncultured Ilyobacter sp.]